MERVQKHGCLFWASEHKQHPPNNRATKISISSYIYLLEISEIKFDSTVNNKELKIDATDLMSDRNRVWLGTASYIKTKYILITIEETSVKIIKTLFWYFVTYFQTYYAGRHL